jgi:Glycosyltransferase family 9 (heptosyltransferase)
MMNGAGEQVLVHLSSGVGNLVFATPLLIALAESGLTVDVRLDADYPPAIELFENWSVVRAIRPGAPPLPIASYSHVLPAVPPFYWSRFAGLYRALPTAARRPPDRLFHDNEQAYYLAFAQALGYSGQLPEYRLPIGPSERFDVSGQTVVIAPGCKTGEMAAKRWPYFPELAERIPDVAVVGTRDDLPARAFPSHCHSYVDRLSVRETAELLAAAGLVVGNDSGLCHVAAAVGTPVLMIFGPTSERVLGPLRSHVRIVRAGLGCEPCWSGERLERCQRRVDCLAGLTVDIVEAEVQRMMCASSAGV